MYIEALLLTYPHTTELVALCDISYTRMNWYNQQLQQRGLTPRPTFHADDFDRMISSTQPDIVIVTTVDATHHHYIGRAMALGCDVITEKPMTTDLPKLKQIFDAIHHTGKSLRVTFNYRYAPAFTQVRHLMQQGSIGKPLAVDFAWLLDTSHGADYFRRWHREKHHSGGLLVHKATHHFDLVNWWLAAYPQQVMAMGDLAFYGQANATQRGEHYAYPRYTGVPEAKNDPFALHLDTNEILRGLYLDAEKETGYVRDQNVFGTPITIEDTMSLNVRYQNGVIMSYCLLAYSPWEGLRVAITGTKGRLELDIIENVHDLSAPGQSATASTGTFEKTTLRLFPMFGQPQAITIPESEGGHGGADPLMLEQLFSPMPPDDPFQRAATHIDGAASILVGIAANESMNNGQMVNIGDLFLLPPKAAI
jgi:predicted dehydrogenase